MAEINFSGNHNQPIEVARAVFAKQIELALAKYPKWLQRVEWSSDRSATLFGPGIEIRLWFDEELVHAKGKVPLFVKLLEAPIASIVREGLRKPMSP
jgi:hypothetical protein